jgi:hypothetical protein
MRSTSLRGPVRRSRFGAFAVAGAVSLLWPPSALAHGLAGQADLPIPVWLFGWGAAVVLIVSFAALALLWSRPQLERDRFRPLPRPVGLALTSRAVEIACGAAGVGVLALVVWAGLAGTRVVSDNLTPTFIYVVFWLGLVPVSVLFGDVLRAFNPWRAVGRATGWALGGRAPDPLPYPQRLGYWPAAAGLFAFAWLELVSSRGDRPFTLAVATLVYSAATWFAMSLYGAEAWSSRGEGFGVYFGLFARLSVFERRGRRIGLRPPLSGLARLEPLPGIVALLAVMIGTVSFDGLSSGPGWQDWTEPLQDALREVLGPQTALELTYGAGLVVVVALVAGFYLLGIAGARTVDRRHSARELARAFAPSLVPIALAYVAAHYVSLLLFRGQALAPLASDPLGRGWDLFGTASWGIDYGYLSAEFFWYLQLGFVLAGHVAALVLCHDRALVVYRDGRLATRSQYWMLAVMVGFTSLALWLLSEASKG